MDELRDKPNGRMLDKDPVVERVVKKLRDRSTVGIEKYGTTLEDNNRDDFLNHLQEELMDGCNYIEKLKSQDLVVIPREDYQVLLIKNQLLNAMMALDVVDWDKWEEANDLADSEMN